MVALNLNILNNYNRHKWSKYSKWNQRLSDLKGEILLHPFLQETPFKCKYRLEIKELKFIGPENTIQNKAASFIIR